jgi:hypothetical protein
MRALLRAARATARRWSLVKWEASGRERYSGQPVTLTYFGRTFGFRTIVHKLFAPGPNARRKGRAWLGVPGIPLTPRDHSGDIVAIELDDAQMLERDTGAGFRLPIWTRTEILVADAHRQMKQSSSLKDDLRRIRKHKIACTISRDAAELRRFYDDIYVPYIRARHGDLSLPDGWEVVIKTAQSGDFITARGADGAMLGGIVLGRSAKRLYARSIGLVSDEKAVLNTGAISALYRACFERAEAYGFDRVGFGLTGPFLNDGLLKFKKKWGVRLLNEVDPGIWLQFNKASTAVKSFLLNNPFMYRDAGTIHGAVFIADPGALDEEGEDTLRASYQLPGMASFHICGVEDGRTQAPSPLMAVTGRRLYNRVS